MQCHYHRPATVRPIVLRHINRIAAAAAGLVVDVHDAGIFLRRLRQFFCKRCIFAQGWFGEELAHRRQLFDQGIERFLRPRRVAQRAEHRDEIAMAVLHRAQAVEGGERRVAGRIERRADVGKFFRPIRHSRAHRLQRLVRLACGLHHAAELRWVKVAGNEAERFQRLQQRRQHGHDVVHHGLAHRRLSDE